MPGSSKKPKIKILNPGISEARLTEILMALPSGTLEPVNPVTLEDIVGHSK